ncbi:MAG: UvrD-helicase domain-containing protein, partial [Acidobacteriota bacterium]
DRILRLVLEEGPKGPPLRLHEICAITFTEKAAGEMKLRLRQHFQHILSEPAEDAARIERARQALYDLETAAISTFHSFAVSLLKERPIEAGLDPRFTALNEIQSELFFRKTWELWIGEALSQRHPALEKALRNGFRLDTLENLARTLRSQWLAVRELPCDSPPTEEELREKAAAVRETGVDLRQQLSNPEDKLAGYFEAALEWLEDPFDSGCAVKKPGGTGAAANWRGGKDTVLEVRDYVRTIVEFREEFLQLPAQKLLHEVVTWLRESFMLGEWEARKHAAGLLDFDDQLRLAYELLLNNPDVRRECLDQYRTLLVDEFQDTDSVQWRMVLLLTSSNILETDFTRLKPEQGRLFLVGDPKQSIYRFRNADIETYLDIVAEDKRESLDLEKLELTTNFRSVPSILEFVDAAFSSAMKADGEAGRYQQAYLAFDGAGFRKEDPNAPAVHILSDTFEEEGSKRSSREFLELESKRIAALIHSMQGSTYWMVRDTEAGLGDDWRAPRYGDMAILLPVLTHASILEDALREREIPYVLEGGKFYYARSEVSSAITVLRSVANPNDKVALYGALRSIFFGFSDEDLLRAHSDGLALDYRNPVEDGADLARPFRILHELHCNRHERRASETFEILLERTGAREVLAVRGFQSLANLGKLGRTLRSLQGDVTFSQTVELLGMMDEERLAESESRLMEERSNAVRVMSIHKAKGLDFPICFVGALGTRKKGRTESILADPHRKKVFALSVGSYDAAVRSKSWKELLEEEKKKEEAELVRLLYVAMTRARDHLVVSTHTAGWKQIDDTEQWAPDVESTRLKPLRDFLLECYSVRPNTVQWIDTASLDAAAIPAAAHAGAGPPDFRSVLEKEYKELLELKQRGDLIKTREA